MLRNVGEKVEVPTHGEPRCRWLEKWSKTYKYGLYLAYIICKRLKSPYFKMYLLIHVPIFCVASQNLELGMI